MELRKRTIALQNEVSEQRVTFTAEKKTLTDEILKLKEHFKL